MHKKIEAFLSDRNYKEISLFGYIYSFLIIIAIAMCIDIIMQNYDDAIIELISIFFVLGILGYLYAKRNIKIASIILMWVAALATFALVIINDFQHTTVLFLWLTPFGFYLVLDRKVVLFHSVVYFFLMLLLLVYGYYYAENRILFDDYNALNSFFIGTLFVIAIGVFIYFAIEHSFEKLEASNRQKEFLLKEVHHRVKNNLNMISSILGLQSDINDKKVQTIITRNRERIQSIALVHEMLYLDENLDKVDSYEYINKLTSQILQAYTKYSITLNLNVSSYLIPLDAMIHIGLMLQEMLVNSIKYAFDEKGIIQITLSKTDNKFLFIYQDNGRGCSAQTLNRHSGLGIELIKISAQKLKSNLNIENINGLSYKMEFYDIQS